MLFGENLGKPAHADAADPVKDMYGFFEMILYIIILPACFSFYDKVHYNLILLICKFFWDKIFSTESERGV